VVSASILAGSSERARTVTLLPVAEAAVVAALVVAEAAAVVVAAVVPEALPVTGVQFKAVPLVLAALPLELAAEVVAPGVVALTVGVALLLLEEPVMLKVLAGHWKAIIWPFRPA
jgi:hypothetical protein